MEISIENRSARTINLPEVQDPESKATFPAYDLRPGKWNLPVAHLRALEAWAQARPRAARVWRHLLSARVLDLSERPVRREGPEAPATLAQLPEARALGMVSVEGDREVLERWAATERRKSVLAAIRKQIAEISAGAGEDPSNS